MRPLLVLALLVAACGGPAASATPGPRTINGTFTLQQDKPVAHAGSVCSGTGGYEDIKDGLGVTVKDDKGTTVGTGRLEGEPGTFSSNVCPYTFSVSVPDAAFYSIEVGHRGALTKSRAELEATGWTVAFTLGG